MPRLTSEEIEPTAGLSIETIKKRSVAGVLALSGRTFFLQLINFASLTFFTILYSQIEYGVYAIVLAIRGFLGYFSDIGLAAALIQKKENITREELKTTFFIQQSLVVFLIIVAFASTPFLARWQQLTEGGVFLLWSAFVAFFLSSLKTIPSVLLERRLEFPKLIVPQILEALVFNGVAIALFLRGFGLYSLAYAMLAESVVGLIAIYMLRPWKPGFAFSVGSLKQLFKYGIPYQMNTFLAVIKDNGLIIFLGGMLGPGGIGLLQWAQKWGQAPLKFFMDQVIKVTFPAFSRLQDNKTELSSALSRSIFFISLLVFPSITGLVLLAPALTEIIPRYEKWQPALLALTLFGINAAIAAVTTPLTNLLNAVGKIRTTFKLMVMWTVLTWLVIPYMAARGGVNGAALGTLVVGLSSAVAIWIAYRTVPFNLPYAVGKPIAASMIMGLVLRLLMPNVSSSLSGVFLLISTGVLIYGVSIFALVGPSLLQDGKKVINAFTKR